MTDSDVLTSEMINVEVAYALPNKQKIVALQVVQGCTAYEAVLQSGIVRLFPEIDLEQVKMGVFAKVIAQPKQEVLQDGDRVEVYRPLIADPKEVRKARAAKAKEEKAQKKRAQKAE